MQEHFDIIYIIVRILVEHFQELGVSFIKIINIIFAQCSQSSKIDRTDTSWSIFVKKYSYFTEVISNLKRANFLIHYFKLDLISDFNQEITLLNKIHISGGVSLSDNTLLRNGELDFHVEN